MVAAKSSIDWSPLRTAVTAGPMTASNSGHESAHNGPSVSGSLAKPFKNAWLFSGGVKVKKASNASWLTRLGTLAPSEAILPCVSAVVNACTNSQAASGSSCGL